MQQLDVFDLEDLKKPLPSDDDLITIATNRLLLAIMRGSNLETTNDNIGLCVQLDRNAINAANTILKKSGGLIDKKQIDHTVHAPKDLNDFYNEQ